ncbi:MAG TPA: hypothetical protein VLW26_13440 [Steroidobacteraceae bacterium]|nr:hypothetical protein [Steroidobacteraceae bacterium]
MDTIEERIGSLLESAQAQQRVAEAAVERFSGCITTFDEVARDEIRRAFIDECEAVSLAGRTAVEALASVARATSVRVALWSVAVIAACTTIPIVVALTLVPSPAQFRAMRTEEEQLRANLSTLRQQGGAVSIRRCGEKSRLCVRVDRGAPAYGANRDYLIAKGY